MFKEKRPGAPRIALVGCLASKCDHPAPARDFYTSRLFRASYAYAEKTCDAVLIVSAFYDVVAPTQKLYPYDRNLRVYNKREREDWGVRTIGQLLPGVDMLPQLVILAGKLYADALLHGAHWHNLPRPEEPLRGIVGCSPRVKWLRLERVRAKIAQLSLDKRCCSDCRAWVVSETSDGVAIQRCDACWYGTADPLTDDEAALLPEAQVELAEQREEQPDSAGEETEIDTSEGSVLLGEVEP